MNFPIALHHIKEIEFFIKELSKQDIENFEEDDLKISLGYDFSIRPEEFLEINIGVKYEHDNEREKQLNKIMEINSLFVFEVNGISNLVTANEDNSIELPNDLMRNVLGISISTSRGIIHCKTQNYFLHDYPLPLFDANDLINS